ncbi:MAG: ABC-F family ATP-binding cassette domain-containing protein [Ruminococcaceae bacterium]|nr:ABC-F family ATP-binding cassette domain-containing protein [Oscillospiraceae bacterium]
MQLKIQNGVVELSGEKILSSVNFEINDTSRIAVVGRNGCGKTTLLKLISGEHEIKKLDSDNDSFFSVTANTKIGILSQMTFADDSVSMLDEIRSAYSEILDLKAKLDIAQQTMEREPTEQNIKNYSNLLDTFNNLGGFYFEREYEAGIKKFGFTEEDKHKPLYEFSGGQRTKIAFLKLLLSKPDILLLDEPTNHLDIEATEWLENYLREYKKAFVVVSHDRMFLDNVAQIVYEIEYGRTYKYVGNYSKFMELKKQLRAQQLKQYTAQKDEIERLNQLVDRFRYKATKAAMVQSKLKQIEKIDLIDEPFSSDNRTFHASFEPNDLGVKDMLSVTDLQIGYDMVLSTVNLDVKLGDKIGIIGGNGLGKSTFIKTLMGQVRAISGEYKFAPRATIGYFDQQMAQYVSKDTVLDDFLKAFPSRTQFEARSALGAFLFSGEDVFKTIDMLSGGEKVRLALCKIFEQKPNFLILDEPTNHMDIIGKETLEDILKNYKGTVIFVSHDRYFIKQIATKVLSFEKGETRLFPFGYEQFLQNSKPQITEEKAKEIRTKKTYTTPLKEKAKRERAIKKAEEKIALLEEKIGNIESELSSEQNLSDYVKLSALQEEKDALEAELFEVMAEWEQLLEND